jgi:crotonobetainyl-CoA:carnitine CoA-transferase CaiB-like acyl-CoA transferase
MSDPTPFGPLAGLKVIELGQLIAGPFAARTLADFGADVIRIEKPGGAEDRFIMPVTDADDGALYLQSNRGKRSIELDAGHPEGRDRFDDVHRILLSRPAAGAWYP